MTQPATSRRQTSRKQAGNTPAKKVAPLRAAPIGDTPIGRFAELLTEIEQPAPYEVTASVSIIPPDRARMGLVITAQSAYVIARGQLESMITPLKDEQGNDLKDDRGEPIMPTVDRAQLNQLEALCNTAAENYDRALFGDAYDEIMRLSEGWTAAVWNAFYQDVQNRFLPLPENGKCPTCGAIVDMAQAGKQPASSTSSSVTGTT